LKNDVKEKITPPSAHRGEKQHSFLIFVRAIITHAIDQLREAASFQHSRAFKKKSCGTFKGVMPGVSDHSRA